MERRKSTRHHHVLVGLSGLYMPDVNEFHRTRRGAEESAAEHARFARDFGDHVTGSAKSGRYYVGDHQAIEITNCDDVSCLSEEEGEV